MNRDRSLMSADDLKRPGELSGIEGAALVDIKVVRGLCGFSSSTPIYDRLREGSFVEPVRLSKRCTRWRLRDVYAWLEAQGAEA